MFAHIYIYIYIYSCTYKDLYKRMCVYIQIYILYIYLEREGYRETCSICAYDAGKNIYIYVYIYIYIYIMQVLQQLLHGSLSWSHALAINTSPIFHYWCVQRLNHLFWRKPGQPKRANIASNRKLSSNKKTVNIIWLCLMNDLFNL